MRHTWSEGVRVCEARQFHNALGQAVPDAHAQSESFSDEATTDMESKAVFVSAHMFVSMPASTLPTMSGATPVSITANESVITPMRKSIAHATARRVTSQAKTATRVKLEHTPANTLAVNGTLFVTMQIDSAGMLRTGPSHNWGRESSASVPVGARKWEKLLRMVACGSAIFIVVRWY